MAEHVAEQIVAAAKTALTGLATTGANVFDSRVYPIQDAELPGLLVDQGEESAAISSMGNSRINERLLDLVVIAKVKQNASYRTLVNTIRKEVETKLDLGFAPAKYVRPKSFELELSGDAEKPVASGTMIFEVLYYTAQGAPDVAL